MTGSLLIPAFVFFIGALILLAVRGKAKQILILAVPIIGFLYIARLNPDATVALHFLQYELNPLHVDKLSKVFGYIFLYRGFRELSFCPPYRGETGASGRPCLCRERVGGGLRGRFFHPLYFLGIHGCLLSHADLGASRLNDRSMPAFGTSSSISWEDWFSWRGFYSTCMKPVRWPWDGSSPRASLPGLSSSASC